MNGKVKVVHGKEHDNRLVVKKNKKLRWRMKKEKQRGKKMKIEIWKYQQNLFRFPSQGLNPSQTRRMTYFFLLLHLVDANSKLD